MVAHLDEVTCLACDPNGLYLLSGSKYYNRMFYFMPCHHILLYSYATLPGSHANLYFLNVTRYEYPDQYLVDTSYH